MDSEERLWRVGELARATGITVRALRHYDRVGLLVPSSRTAAGYRCYTGADVRRLHVILALRGFGLSLAEVGRTLGDDAGDPREILRRQLDAADERIRRAMAVRTRVNGMLGLLDQLTEPSVSAFVDLIEGMVLMEQRMTPEQFAAMSRRRQELAASLSDEERAEMDKRREEAMAALSPEQIEQMQRERARWRPVEA
ncbi:transcriptional regulator [Actinoplanes sp. OR16]|uniref:MerR family transcriptional regulator n=1 Tax=Actinoplanes sp. OR16 TaxID=946334 RepID=UPI000F6E7FA3|nr:MerR family transcriptional regulator [Actinoplanes sp. OR16]BBH69610.1 transcriptional regulator [Actinoplanes sp. OR16]